jgi:uncharacterized protein YjiS (DUF1127 family)
VTRDNDEFDSWRYDRHALTPDERDALMRRAIARAKACRAEMIRNAVRRVCAWFRQRAAIARLRRLDDRMLKDMGIYRSEIEAAVRGSERSAGASVMSRDPTRPAKPRAITQRGHGHVGKAA